MKRRRFGSVGRPRGDDQKRVQRHMSSENTDSCDDSQVKDVKEEGEKEVDNDSSADVSID